MYKGQLHGRIRLGARLDLGRREFCDSFVNVIGEFIDFLGGGFTSRAGLLMSVRKVGEPIPHVANPGLEILEFFNLVRAPALIPLVRWLTVRNSEVACCVLKRVSDPLFDDELVDIDGPLGFSCKTNPIRNLDCMFKE